MQSQNKNLIYLYDLPKAEFTSALLAGLLKDAGIELEHKPQIRRDPTKPFYSGIMCIKNEEMYKKAAEFLRYFHIAGKPCRGLAFDNSLLGSNLTKTNENCNIFVRKIPTVRTHGKDMTPAEFDQRMSSFDPAQKHPVKSLKISMNEDHTSRGYGFVCFETPEDAAKACEMMDETATHQECISVKWNPKDRQDIRRMFNNLYVKNYPDNFSDEDLKNLFMPFGNVASLAQIQHPNGKFAFVCYMSEDKNDHQYGPEKAFEAIEALNGRDMGDGKQLYVKPALAASKRKEELLRETIKYKNSKKRCNLYVKNFEPKFTEKDLAGIFQEYGEIESIKMFPIDKAEKAYAFVCFKTPDQAQQALQYCHNRLFNQRQLQICHYELKEFRQIQDEETKDKLGFQQFKQLNYQNNHWQDISSRDEFYYKITQLLQTLPMQGGNNGLQQMARGQQQRDGHRQGGNFQGGNNNGGYNNRPKGGNNSNSRGPMNNNMGGDMNQNRRQQMPQGPAVELPGAHNMKQPMMAQSQDPQAQAYYQKTAKIVPSCKADNPHLKQSVGNAIFDFVTQLKGPELAPKITGMLIDLPLNETQSFLTNYGEFRQKVEEAASLLIRTSGAPASMGQQPGMPTPGMPSMPGMPMPGMPGMPTAGQNFPGM